MKKNFTLDQTGFYSTKAPSPKRNLQTSKITLTSSKTSALASNLAPIHSDTRIKMDKAKRDQRMTKIKAEADERRMKEEEEE